MNGDEHEEEERNDHINGQGYREEDHREDDHQEDRGDAQELRNRRPNCHGDWREDAGDLTRIIAELNRKCTHMEMEKKDKSNSLVLDRLLLATDSPFIRWVAYFRLPEKFKVTQIMSYAGDRDSLDHVENFPAHLDLHRTSDEVACQAFPLNLLGKARDWF